MKWLLDLISGLLGRGGGNVSDQNNVSSLSNKPTLQPPKLDPSAYAERLLVEVEKAGKMPDDFTPEKEYVRPYGYTPVLGPDGKPKTTYCNYFVRKVASWFGWTEWCHEDDDQASEITRYMAAHPEYWKRLAGTFMYTDSKTKQKYAKPGPDYVQAAELATQGHLVIAGWVNPDGKAAGHVCIIAPESPSNMLFSNKWGINVPIAVNVGKDNWYGKTLSWAFGEEPQLFLFNGRST
jgi:hypothetical protein